MDSPNFDGGYLTVHFAQGGTSGDTLAIRNQGTSAGQIGVAGSNVTYGGVIIGTFTGGMSGAQLSISFNANATQAAISALLENITFATTGSGATTKEVHIWVSDGDGTDNFGWDVNGAVAFINVAAANAAPTANGDNVITNVALGSSFAIPEWALLNNDTDPEGATLDVTTVSVGSGGTAAHTPGIGNGGHVSFTDPAPAGGSFTYSATDGTTASPSATVTVTQDAVGDLNGTASADILLGSGSVTFVGGDGHDVLIAITSGSNNIYQFDLNDGSDIINDASGTEDRVRIATASSTDPIGTLGFERVGSNLVIDVGSTEIVVRNHYAGTAVEKIQFTNGGTLFGYLIWHRRLLPINGQ